MKTLISLMMEPPPKVPPLNIIILTLGFSHVNIRGTQIFRPEQAYYCHVTNEIEKSKIICWKLHIIK